MCRCGGPHPSGTEHASLCHTDLPTVTSSAPSPRPRRLSGARLTGPSMGRPWGPAPRGTNARCAAAARRTPRGPASRPVCLGASARGSPWCPRDPRTPSVPSALTPADSVTARGPRRSRLPVTAPVGSQSSRQLRSFCLSPPYGKGETPPPLSIFWKLQHHLFLSCLISCPSLQPGQCWGAPSPKSRGTRLLSGPSPVCTSCPSLRSFLYLLLSPNATPVSVVSC